MAQNLIHSAAFIEQAEYLNPSDFAAWGASHPDEEKILRKLTQSGAKLISGPRGCGKTTLLFKAYYKTLKSSSVLPIYINFKHALSMEPLYVSGDKGTFHFLQWIILKVMEGAYRTLSELESHVSLSLTKKEIDVRLASLEAGTYMNGSFQPLTVGWLEDDLMRITEKFSRDRCVLLMDDAAHAFSPDQQRDFFDFFRQVKSRVISPKAAIYPGVTSYSSSFHVGHDAEEIDVWVKPDRPGYLPFMHRVIEGRFSEVVVNALFADRKAIDFICYASFGIPRAFLTVIYSLIEASPDGLLEIKRRDVLAEVRGYFQNTLKVFRSISQKVPTLKNFIENGEQSLVLGFDAIKEYNKGKPVEKQSVSMAVNANDMSPELVRLFSLFQYAGLCIAKGAVSRGEKGRFEIFVLHYSGLISSNAMLGRKSLSIDDYVVAFAARDAHEFTRVAPTVLTRGRPVTEFFELSLPPCSVCGAARLNKDARFCSNCGARLTLSSAYKHLISQDISELPLTDNRVAKIKAQSSIRQVKDILLDREHKELMQVDRVGPYWAERIVRLAEEFVE